MAENSDVTDRKCICLEDFLVHAEEGRLDDGFPTVKPEGTSEHELQIETCVDTSLPRTPRRNRIKYDPILNNALTKAVKLNDREGVEKAVTSGADAGAQSPPFFIPPLQIASWLGNNNMVEYLIDAGASPNSADSYGRTPLHLAAALGFKDCVDILLKKGAKPNVTTKSIPSSELAPRGLANAIVLSASSIAGKGYNFDPYLDGLQMPMMNCTTPLHEAVKANSLECVTLILASGGDPNAVDGRGFPPLLLAGAGVIPQDQEAVSKYEDVVAELLNSGANATTCDPGTGTSALHNAVALGSTAATILLLSKNADPGWSSTSGGSTTALHEAAGHSNVDILRILLLSEEDVMKRRILANLEDAIGRTPLHKAAYAGSRSCLSFLIDNGANLGLRTKTGVTAMEAMLLHVPRPKRFLCSLLDSRIRCNSAAAEERGFLLYLDFEILAPEGGNRQTGVLNSIITTKSVSKQMRRAILLHPMVEAFVRLKWHRLRKFFFAVVVVYAMFVVSLSLYVTLEYLYPSNSKFRDANCHKFILATRYIHLIFAFMVLLNVIGQCIAHFKYYARQFETWTNGVSALLSLVWTLAGDSSNTGIPAKDNHSWVQHFISIAVPLSWTGLMLLMGRFPLWGSHALLFAAVLKNVLWTFIVLGCIVLGFSFSFFVQFHDTHSAAFGNPWRAFVKTMVMMTGEYEYTNIFSEEGAEKVLPGTSRVTFLMFVVVASIVLVNLIVGLAVSDTQALKSEGEARCLYKRAEFVDLLEFMVSPLARRQALPTKVTLLPNGLTNEKGYELAHHLPRSLLDGLVDIAVMKRDDNMSKEGASRDNISWMSNVFSGADTGNLENRVFNMLETFLRDVTLVLAPDGTDIDRRVAATPKLSRFGSQVIRARRAMRNHGNKKDDSLVPSALVEAPSLRIQC